MWIFKVILTLACALSNCYCRTVQTAADENSDTNEGLTIENTPVEQLNWLSSIMQPADKRTGGVTQPNQQQGQIGYGMDPDFLPFLQALASSSAYTSQQEQPQAVIAPSSYNSQQGQSPAAPSSYNSQQPQPVALVAPSSYNDQSEQPSAAPSSYNSQQSQPIALVAPSSYNSQQPQPVALVASSPYNNNQQEQPEAVKQDRQGYYDHGGHGGHSPVHYGNEVRLGVPSLGIKFDPFRIIKALLGLIPRPLFTLNGKLFFGVELGKKAGIGFKPPVHAPVHHPYY